MEDTYGLPVWLGVELKQRWKVLRYCPSELSWSVAAVWSRAGWVLTPQPLLCHWYLPLLSVLVFRAMGASCSSLILRHLNMSEKNKLSLATSV